MAKVAFAGFLDKQPSVAHDVFDRRRVFVPEVRGCFGSQNFNHDFSRWTRGVCRSLYPSVTSAGHARDFRVHVIREKIGLSENVRSSTVRLGADGFHDPDTIGTFVYHCQLMRVESYSHWPNAPVGQSK
jgi:hypothetical protein